LWFEKEKITYSARYGSPNYPNYARHWDVVNFGGLLNPCFNGVKRCFLDFDLEFFARVEKKNIELDQTQVWWLGADIAVPVRPYIGVYDDIIWSGSDHTHWS